MSKRFLSILFIFSLFISTQSFATENQTLTIQQDAEDINLEADDVLVGYVCDDFSCSFDSKENEISNVPLIANQKVVLKITSPDGKSKKITAISDETGKFTVNGLNTRDKIKITKLSGRKFDSQYDCSMAQYSDGEYHITSGGEFACSGTFTPQMHILIYPSSYMLTINAIDENKNPYNDIVLGEIKNGKENVKEITEFISFDVYQFRIKRKSSATIELLDYTFNKFFNDITVNNIRQDTVIIASPVFRNNILTPQTIPMDKNTSQKDDAYFYMEKFTDVKVGNRKNLSYYYRAKVRFINLSDTEHKIKQKVYVTKNHILKLKDFPHHIIGGKYRMIIKQKNKIVGRTRWSED